MSLYKVNVGEQNTLLAPVVPENITGTYCLTCLKSVDSEEVMENLPGCGKPWSRVVARCHGSEQEATLNMGTEYWTKEDFTKAMRSQRWFDPTHIAGVKEYIP